MKGFIPLLRPIPKGDQGTQRGRTSIQVVETRQVDSGPCPVSMTVGFSRTLTKQLISPSIPETRPPKLFNVDSVRRWGRVKYVPKGGFTTTGRLDR